MYNNNYLMLLFLHFSFFLIFQEPITYFLKKPSNVRSYAEYVPPEMINRSVTFLLNYFQINRLSFYKIFLLVAEFSLFIDFSKICAYAVEMKFFISIAYTQVFHFYSFHYDGMISLYHVIVMSVIEMINIEMNMK